MAPSFTPETFIWQPKSPAERLPAVALPIVRNQLAVAGNRPAVLLLPGLGETAASAVMAAELFDRRGIPAAAAWLDYAALPVTTANLERTAIEAPTALAEYLSQGHEALFLITNSLGSLAVNAAVEAPERFAGVGVQAPFAFSHQAYGRLPFIGAFDVTRIVSAGVRLGVQTPLQLWSQWKDPHVQVLAGKAIGDIRALGLFPGTAIRHAFSSAIGRRTVNGFVRLGLSGHPTHVVNGRDDKLNRPREVVAGLTAAAIACGVDTNKAPAHVKSLLRIVEGPHLPWCLPGGVGQLDHLALWMQSVINKRMLSRRA